MITYFHFQTIWNLNYLISVRKDNLTDIKLEEKFETEINNFINKIDNTISSFRFNVSIAHFYEIYKFFKNQVDTKINNKVLEKNIIKIMKLMIPFTPHLAYECLELHNCKTIDKWPEIKKNGEIKEIKLAVQINGKTRDIITIEKDLIEKDISKIILKESKAQKYIKNKEINKIIFVKNKIINYII